MIFGVVMVYRYTDTGFGCVYFVCLFLLCLFVCFELLLISLKSFGRFKLDDCLRESL